MPFYETVNPPDGILVVEVHGAEGSPVLGFHLHQSFAVARCSVTRGRILDPRIEQFKRCGILMVIKVVSRPFEIRGVFPVGRFQHLASDE